MDRKITSVVKFKAIIAVCLFITSKHFTYCPSVITLWASTCSKSTIKTLEQPFNDIDIVILLLTLN